MALAFYTSRLHLWASWTILIHPFHGPMGDKRHNKPGLFTLKMEQKANLFVSPKDSYNKRKAERQRQDWCVQTLIKKALQLRGIRSADVFLGIRFRVTWEMKTRQAFGPCVYHSWYISSFFPLCCKANQSQGSYYPTVIGKRQVTLFIIRNV